jgi:hypothetical protein
MMFTPAHDPNRQTSARVPKQKTKSGVTAGKTRRRIDNTHETLAWMTLAGCMVILVLFLRDHFLPTKKEIPRLGSSAFPLSL